MQVTFYNFAKKINSTARPSGGVSYECYLKDNCSQLSPQIVLQNFLNAPHFNYCYIPEFSRYYYVSNITWEAGGIWVFDLAVDVLASYRHLIAENNLYCTRTSNPTYYDRNLIDHLYPSTVNTQVEHQGIVSPFLKEDILQLGTFVVGVINRIGTLGGVTYYAMNYDNLLYFCSFLLDSSFYNWDSEEITTNLAESIVNPFQYVVSSMFFPFRLSTIPNKTRANKIQWGWWDKSDIGAWEAYIIDPVDGLYHADNFNEMPTLLHPQTIQIGSWLNSTPYSRMSLLFEPFGSIVLDPMDFVEKQYLMLSMKVDLVTGKGVLFIGNDPEVSAEVEPLHVINAQVGVDIMLSASNGYGGLVTSAMNRIGSGFSNLGLGAIGSTISGIGEAIASIISPMESVGHSGSLAMYTVNPTLVQSFQPVKQIDVDHKGKPSCVSLRLASIAGGGYNHFYQFDDGDIAISVSASELQEIKNFLENGIFYEE